MTSNNMGRGYVVLTFAPRATPVIPQSPPTDVKAPEDVYARLERAIPEEKATIVRELVDAHPDGRLVLPRWGGRRADLREADLAGARLGSADLRGADLRGADLADATLGEANLAGAVLEGTDLRGADLAAASLRVAALGEANLQGALLEDADLQDAGLRFANLREAALEGAHLERADLWGATLDGAILTGATLTGARIGEASLRGADLTGADLRDVDLGRSDLEGARLTGANLQGASLAGARLRGAVLSEARLQDLDLSTCDLAHIHVGGARLDGTRLRRDQLGGAIGEELAGDYETAATGYLALERNFVGLGDPDAGRWAYGKKRRMQKRAAWARARAAARAQQWGAAGRCCATYASDQVVEWLCDYGESVLRVLGALVVAYLAFTLFYSLTGSVMRVTGDVLHPVRVTTRNPLDLAVFSLASMTTQSPLGMQPRDASVQLPTGLETLTGIFLTGLLGFVAGNRIRR